MNPTRLSAVILAAGTSSRMGRFKPLLPLGERSAIERLVETFTGAGVAEPIVVVGHRGDEIARKLRGAPVRIVENPDFARGMYSSVRAGVRALDPVPDRFFIHPVDIPLVRPWTLRRLAARSAAEPVKVVHPTFRGLRGHPPLLPGRLAAQIAADETERGLHVLLAAEENRSVEEEVPDRHILMDMDEPDDYRSLQERWRHRLIPDEAECRVIVDGYARDSDSVWRHGRAVAEAAQALAAALGAAGRRLDTGRIRAAALLHDLAKGAPDHARKGAELLRAMGFSSVADIVACHMALDPDPAAPVGEAEVVFMADKYVEADRRISLEARYRRSLDRFGENPEARENIRRRLAAAAAVRDRIERLAGRSVAAILALTPT